MTPYEVGDWISVGGRMAQVAQRYPVGERDFQLLCKVPDLPFLIRVLAKNVTPGSPPRGRPLECIWTNPAPPKRTTFTIDDSLQFNHTWEDGA